jgi:hypothetical protein
MNFPPKPAPHLRNFIPIASIVIDRVERLPVPLATDHGPLTVFARVQVHHCILKGLDDRMFYLALEREAKRPDFNDLITLFLEAGGIPWRELKPEEKPVL